MFTSGEADREKAYEEFLRGNENPETHIGFLRGNTSLFGRTTPWTEGEKKDLLEERFTKRESDGKNDASVCKKRKTLLLHV